MFVVIGLAILTGRNVPRAALVAGGLVFVWSLLRHIPVLTATSGLMVFSWFWTIHVPRTLMSESAAIAVFEALLTAGSLFVITGFLYERQPVHEAAPASSRTGTHA